MTVTSARLWERGRETQRDAARFLVERPVWQLALAVWITHGVLDGVVTVGAVAVLETTTIESNPWLRPTLLAAHREAFTYPYSYVPFWRPLALKLGVAGVAALGVAALERALPRRVVAWFAAILSGVGIVVVSNNLLALRGVVA